MRHRVMLLSGWTLAIVLCAMVCVPDAAASSALRLALEAPFGVIPAATYDEASGKRLGDAGVSLTALPSGNLLLTAVSAIEGAESIAVSTELERTEDGDALRPIWQQSHSWRRGGATQGMMWIDHRRGVAVCTPADGSGETAREIPLTTPDRVANVPMTLVLQALARDPNAEVTFQFVACRAGRIADVKAQVAPGTSPSDGLVEVRSELDLGPVLTPLARAFLPHFSFWFQPGLRGAWAAHRMPLFTGGPQVLIVRTGVSLGALGASR